ncbi:hypothetical protein ACFVZH_36175 [Streptomyces sp. NPDC059534]|uniref:hypothetical protein n=1 Tax=Streptomyces sp. NPDC059534 TaxID=3346859 RepID=UPI00369D3BB3
MMCPNGIGALLRSVREDAGRAREQQARLVEKAQGGRWFDPENLKRWETERRLPVAIWHEPIATACGLTAGDVRRAVATSREYRRHQGRERTDVNGRRFIGAAAAAAAAGISALLASRRPGKASTGV